jgi:hypothetical protein
VAEADLITQYIHGLRGSMRRRRGVDDVLLELEDHLRECTAERVLAGNNTTSAQRDSLHAFGSSELVANAFRLNPNVGLIVPTRFTRNAGIGALLAASFWVISAGAGAYGQGSLLTEWTQRNYAIWNTLTAIAVLASVVAIAGGLMRAGRRHDVLTTAGLGLAVIGSGLLIVGTWAWPMTSLVLAAAGLIVVLRLRATGLGSPTDWLLALSWPFGLGVVILLEELGVGPVDSYGDHAIAAVVGFAFASTMYAVGLASLGARLRVEEPGNRHADSATV